ncbi:YicC/YloC family endoribonuclease [Lachnospira eligens]|uniref:YicC/YloC family endoribonuclease n=1 Tax=Lachnospira eligens TaxID=39485 RepID=UPI00189805EA|nr:YicC/YloC family endoribonuclease [Lachnospira eligens]
MIKSMTGFGRSEIVKGNRKISVEIKSVNHRYLEAGIKMPKKLNVFESRMRDLLKKYATRGKIDIFINYEDDSESQVNLKFNQNIADEYMAIFNNMSEKYNLKNDMTVGGLARFPEVITMDEVQEDEEELWHFIEDAMKAALEQFVNTRILEGENLKKDLLGKLDHMEELVAFVEKRSPEIMKEYRSKLESKVKELLGDTTIDESRIATEVIIYADKICVDEETVRLRSHIEHARKCLNEDGGIGRKMDFIAQEMNREANTTLSKANDIEISNAAIDLKTEIEKVREQIQNIE